MYFMRIYKIIWYIVFARTGGPYFRFINICIILIYLRFYLSVVCVGVSKKVLKYKINIYCSHKIVQ